ncbi:MAG: DUF4178 domain-containing protein [bacterium]
MRFRWSGAVQTTCEYCQSILVRNDLNLALVGKAADLPVDISPVQIGTEGIFNGKGFQVIGRIVYRYDLGTWNEWHLLFSDDSHGWLSDAQAEYAVSFANPFTVAPPAEGYLERGMRMEQHGVQLTLTVITEAFYETTEGELPFRYYDKEKCRFADFRTSDGRFATVDYSEEPPLLFLGQFVDFGSWQMKNLKEFEGWPTV